jgi:hypothetical protein
MLNYNVNGGEAFKVDVNRDFQFVPKKVTVVGKEGGMIRYMTDSDIAYNKTVKEYNKVSGFLWYSCQFFTTESECLAECEMMEREAAGEITPRKMVERAKVEKVKAHFESNGLTMILPPSAALSTIINEEV